MSKKYIYTRKLIHILDEFSIIYKSIGNSIKSDQYSKASLSIQNYNKKKIYSGKEIYINTGKIKKLEMFRKNKKIKAYINLTSIYGIGPKKAEELIKKNIYSICELKNNSSDLTKIQKLGLKYHNHLSKKISRKESKKIHKKLDKIFKTIYKYGKTELLGSYILGKKKSKDIDIIIYIKNNNNIDNILLTFVTKLYEKKILVDSLSSKKIPDKTSRKYVGIIKLSKNSFRHIDIHSVKWEELPFYTLYFGSGKYFSKIIRKHAKKNGYILNEKSLYKNNKKIIVKNEKEIFSILKIRWIPPEKRNNILKII